MNVAPRSAARLVAETTPNPVRLDRFVRSEHARPDFARQDGRPQRMMPLMRKVEVACLSPNGDIHDISRLVPALPAFEEAFSAFTRATLMTTERGVVAVGDLWPGDRVRTVDNGFQTLLWKGSTMLVSGAPGQDPTMGRLTRIAADSLGIARPMPDLVLGPRARIVHRAQNVERLTGTDAALIPARDFIDGISIIELTPPAPVETFHLGFARHERLVANGVEVESWYPGPLHNLGLNGEMLGLFLSCFPHLQGTEDIGPLALPRLRLGDLDVTPAREA